MRGASNAQRKLVQSLRYTTDLYHHKIMHVRDLRLGEVTFGKYAEVNIARDKDSLACRGSLSRLVSTIISHRSRT